MQGVIIRPLTVHRDERGSLCELFRRDELSEGFDPQMGYISWTAPGVTRGPHEHREQTDCFCFLDGKIELWLWEGDVRAVMWAGVEKPCLVVIQPGVVHAYTNVGTEPAFVLNFPDRLYRGKGRAEPPDEIRHENDPGSPYKL